MDGDTSNRSEEDTSPGEGESALAILYRQLDAAQVRISRLKRDASPYTRVEAEMLKRRHDDINRQIKALVARRRKT